MNEKIAKTFKPEVENFLTRQDFLCFCSFLFYQLAIYNMRSYSACVCIYELRLIFKCSRKIKSKVLELRWCGSAQIKHRV